MKDCKYYCEGYYSDDIGYDEKDKIDACGLTRTGYHEMSYKKCSDITNCYYKQLLAEQEKNKKLVEALELALSDTCYDAKTCGYKCQFAILNQCDLFKAGQALNEVNK